MPEFEGISSITPAIATKLVKKGINTVEALATQTFNDLKEKLGDVPDQKILDIQAEVWKIKGYWFTPASRLAEIRKQELVFPIGCKALDDLLGGGIRSRAITEFVGAYAAGKTESLETLLVETLARNPSLTAIFFDTEETFKDVRVSEIARSRGFDDQDILERTIYTPVWHTQHFQMMIDQADVLIKSRNVKLILIDSLTATLRAEYVGRETLWHRQQLLNKILRTLLNYAKAFNLAVVVTNQVVADPSAIFTQDPVKRNVPVGGHILAHNAETRIYMRQSSKPTVIIARLIDSSWLPPGECTCKITKKGIDNAEEEKEETRSEKTEKEEEGGDH